MMVTKDALKQAYRQAYFLHTNVGTAVEITARGFLLAKNLARKQNQRGNYTPSPASSTKRLPNKVTLTDSQLWQRAIWEVSEYYERLEEAAQFGTKAPVGPPVLFTSETESFIKVFSALLDPTPASGSPGLTEEDMLIRYLKHLAKISVPHNALHVAIAFNQFLFDYKTREMLLIYEGVDTEFERGSDETRVESTRVEMWEKRLKPRFDGILQPDRTENRRAIFKSSLSDTWRRAFVRDCLEKLTLWETNCSDGSGDADLRENHRIHKLVHPDCHDQLIAQAGLALSAERLRLPIFPDVPVQTGGQGKSGDRFNPPDLPENVYRHLQELFDNSNQRQRQSSANQLLIIVDGLEKTQLNLLVENSTRCFAPDGAQLIEVYSRETVGDLLLATHWLTEFDEGNERVIAETRAEGGQVVRFDIAFAEGSEAAVTISYRETKVIRWLSLEWQRLAYRFQQLSFKPKPLTAWAMAGAAALALLFTLWVWLQKPNELPKVAKQASPTVEPSPVALPSPTVELPLIAENRPKPQTGKKRSGAIRSPEVSLSSVTRVFVQSLGEDEFSRSLREALIAKLRQSPLTVEDQILPATDAVLQTKPGSNKRQVTLRLVNRAGDILWQARFKQRDARQIAEQTAEKLVGAIEAEKRKSQ